MRPTPTTSGIGRAVRRLRQARGLSIESLAGDAGMSPTYLSEIERGHVNPKVAETLLPLAEALNIKLYELMLAVEAETEGVEAPGARRLTPEESEERFRHPPTDGEG